MDSWSTTLSSAFLAGPHYGQETLTESLQAFSDWQISIKTLTAEGDKVFSRCKCEATHSGQMFGLAPTEKHVSWTANYVLRIDYGRIAEITAEEEMLDVMTQLGAAPPPTWPDSFVISVRGGQCPAMRFRRS
jgi:predicted ester cyclase